MIRRLIGPVLGAIGLVAVVVGGLGLLLRPPPVDHPTAIVDTTAVVIPPAVLALEGLGEIAITAPGAFDIRTARPSDAYAWVATVDTSVVRGLASWEDLRIDHAGSATGAIPDFPGDLWREWWLFFEETTIEASEVEPGLAMLIVSGSDAPIGEITFTVTHDRGNGWAWPVLTGGLGSVAVGLGFIIMGLLQTRPRASKGVEA
ncbi:MAG: hypothetical protein JW722_03685 [Demequinaceae bacterium]|nr:hypothetical protein [Demequinaceae bacterium]